MKILIPLFAIFLLFGCSSRMMYESYLDIDNLETGAHVYTASTASIHGKDLRPQKEVVHYNLASDSPSRLANAVPVQKLLTGRLASAFQQQGLQLAADAPVTLTLEIGELLGVVTRSKLLYKTEASSTIRFVINNRGATLTKDYTRQAEKESLTLPDLWDVEIMLEEQLNEILDLIVNDEKIWAFIQKNR